MHKSHEPRVLFNTILCVIKFSVVYEISAMLNDFIWAVVNKNLTENFHTVKHIIYLIDDVPSPHCQAPAE